MLKKKKGEEVKSKQHRCEIKCLKGKDEYRGLGIGFTEENLEIGLEVGFKQLEIKVGKKFRVCLGKSVDLFIWDRQL